MNEPTFREWDTNGRGWRATHISYWEGNDRNWEDLEKDPDTFACLVVLHDNWENAYHDGGHSSLRRWLEGSFDLEEHKVHNAPLIGHEFVAAGYLQQSLRFGSQHGPVTERNEAAARYRIGQVAVYLYANFTTPEVNPALASAASKVALERATQRVVDMAVEMDARYRETLTATSTAETRGKDLLDTKGLPKMDVRPRLSRE